VKYPNPNTIPRILLLF